MSWCNQLSRSNRLSSNMNLTADILFNALPDCHASRGIPSLDNCNHCCIGCCLLQNQNITPRIVLGYIDQTGAYPS